jgi:Flp pilus assembly pilin Flp
MVSGIVLLILGPAKHRLPCERGVFRPGRQEEPVARFLCQLWRDDRGQDVAEYAVMLAVVLVIVVGTIRLIGANANNVFSSVASSVSQ